jgi:2-keto-4-pentenoate hydratase/2-oxohepta-3-ene-1,7-dioic acid hydratase in catechol pathway
MAQRYVRVQLETGAIHYGLLELNRAVRVLDAPPWLQGQLTDQELPSDRYRLLSPCTPSKIVAVGKNYQAHAAEMQTPVPQEPLLFLKPPTAVIGSNQAVYIPPQARRVDYEGELALVIGEVCVNCSLEAAPKKIWGYTIANDVTARDLQQRDGQWTRAKGFDTFCPLGPWIVREISPGAQLQTFLNDTLVQSAAISEMIFAPDVLVAYISQVMTLLPGDIILTGTPAGVGAVRLHDTVRIEIEGIGSLESPIDAKPTVPTPPLHPATLE